MSRALIKVCGMRQAENIRDVERLLVDDGTSGQEPAVDMMGFIFWPQSSRFVSERPAYLPKCKRVGVFVDACIDDIMRSVEDYTLDMVQLHGHESPEQVSHLLSLVSHLSVIKAFNIATEEDLLQTRPYEGLADSFLFDTKGKSVGGNGEQFDWGVLDAYHGATPFLLSGGIGPDDADRIKAFRHPRCMGVDLNSRFELAPGLKDVDKLRTFISAIRGK